MRCTTTDQAPMLYQQPTLNMSQHPFSRSTYIHQHDDAIPFNKVIRLCVSLVRLQRLVNSETQGGGALEPIWAAGVNIRCL